MIQQQQQQQEDSNEIVSPILIPIQKSSCRNHNSNNNNDDPPTTIPEWAMLELNGDLLLPHEMPNNNSTITTNTKNTTNDLLELGALKWDSNHPENPPFLICGTHELQGQLEILKQPFVVLQKQPQEEEMWHYTIQGYITHKLLFNRYPKTILS